MEKTRARGGPRRRRRRRKGCSLARTYQSGEKISFIHRMTWEICRTFSRTCEHYIGLGIAFFPRIGCPQYNACILKTCTFSYVTLMNIKRRYHHTMPIQIFLIQLYKSLYLCMKYGIFHICNWTFPRRGCYFVHICILLAIKKETNRLVSSNSCYDFCIVDYHSANLFYKDARVKSNCSLEKQRHNWDKQHNWLTKTDTKVKYNHPSYWPDTRSCTKPASRYIVLRRKS